MDRQRSVSGHPGTVDGGLACATWNSHRAKGSEGRVAPARATFPARPPLLPLDRILCDVPGAVTGLRAIATPAIRVAADHLPLAARMTL